MKPIRRSALFAFVLGGLLLGALTGCAGGNPFLSSAEDAMEQQNYEQALANVDSALAKDSANVEAYKLRAQVLRQMADSTMEPEQYKALYRRARKAEDRAIKYDPGSRSEVDGNRTLTYTQEYQNGAKAFRRAQRTADSSAFRKAASHFGAAAVTFPDSSDAILNEAYAFLNMQRLKQNGSMTDAIPILERYVEKEDRPQKNAYDILSALYLQNGETKNAISLLETARKDLSARPTHFQLSGSRGLKYSGSIQVGGSARKVEGTVPKEISVDGDGLVSATFQKQQEKGQLRVQLFYRGSAVKDTVVQSGSASISVDLSEQAPLAQLEGRLLNAYNRAGMTEKAMAEYRQQIEENPNNATYRYNYGSMLLSEDRFDEAVEQLKKAVEIEPGNVKAQYNLGAAYTNKGKGVQDSLRAVEDSLSSIRDAVMEENRELTAQEKQIVDQLDRKSKVLAQKKRNIYSNAIPPLERARQLADSGESLRRDACRALITAYVQTEQVEKAEELEQCAGMNLQQGGN